MRKARQKISSSLKVQASIAKALCHEQAIHCGYAALAAAIEGNAWKRSRNLNLMRRLASCQRMLDAWTIGGIS